MDASNFVHLRPHPFADIFPLVEGETFAKLVESIRQDGLISPIVVFQGKILDGRNRHRACLQLITENDFEFSAPHHIKTFKGTEQEALAYAAALNLARRHLTSSQRAMVGARLAIVQNDRIAAEREGAMSTAAAAEALSVSPFLVKQAKRVRRGSVAHIVAMVERGEITLSTAEAVANLPADRQASLRTPDAVKAAAERQRRAMGPFAGYSPERVLETIIAVSAEPFARSDLNEFAAAARADTVSKLDEAIERISKVRDAIVQSHSSAKVLA